MFVVVVVITKQHNVVNVIVIVVEFQEMVRIINTGVVMEVERCAMAADHGEGGEGHAGDGNSIMDEGRSTEVSSLIAAEAAEVEFLEMESCCGGDGDGISLTRLSANGHVAVIWREVAYTWQRFGGRLTTRLQTLFSFTRGKDLAGDWVLSTSRSAHRSPSHVSLLLCSTYSRSPKPKTKTKWQR
jgi:hypothetical protein